METEILETQWNSVQFDILVTSFTFTYIQIMMEGSFQGRCMAENLWVLIGKTSQKKTPFLFGSAQIKKYQTLRFLCVSSKSTDHFGDARRGWEQSVPDFNSFLV